MLYYKRAKNFENTPVRAVWDDDSHKWWYCAMDVAEVLTNTMNPRVYWATVKRRRPELIAICKQLKLKARDGKFYNTDVEDDAGLNIVIASIPSKKKEVFAKLSVEQRKEAIVNRLNRA